MTDSTVPRPALLLGLSGLLPSVAMLAAMLALPEWRDAAARIGLGYGAVIASFIGGAWWGLVAARPDAGSQARLLALAVVPSLLAWPALLLSPAAGLLLLALVFAAVLPTDARLRRDGFAPAWWMGLRRPLSLGMALIHAAAAVLLVLSAAPPRG
jgi:hypothetical protein